MKTLIKGNAGIFRYEKGVDFGALSFHMELIRQLYHHNFNSFLLFFFLDTKQEECSSSD